MTDQPANASVPQPSRLETLMRSDRAGEVFRFLVTGGIAYLADVLIFNVLLFSGVHHLTSRVVSSVIAIGIAFLGSRYYTWAHRRSEHPGREYAMFFLLSAVAAGIQVLCLYISHNVLGFTSALADNISSNIIGMALAMVFRFLTFRSLVFPDRS
ncbi:putative flippase GtrA [Kineococcus xinjiangensis]|uniref:Putative flippase GtrA n=1 Tax=Kineococcus xinjiangensis TaxID=512762 RepID=A0A2S6IU64_9ACTN|nr:GtrA family protein [Kineococcus xinjiangensis]PPK97758.1 putative flippase GtrA [Kineococcus xinjiangensis]